MYTEDKNTLQRPCVKGEVNLRNRIPEILDRINFDRIQKTMAALNWTWWDPTSGYYIPDTIQLCFGAERILMQCIELWEQDGRPASGYMATGGFEVVIQVFSNADDGEDISLRLSFSVESAE